MKWQIEEKAIQKQKKQKMHHVVIAQKEGSVWTAWEKKNNRSGWKRRAKERKMQLMIETASGALEVKEEADSSGEVIKEWKSALKWMGKQSRSRWNIGEEEEKKKKLHLVLWLLLKRLVYVEIFVVQSTVTMLMMMMMMISSPIYFPQSFLL